ncbi:kielin/chordin-like protein isoform X2 [Venturia canescens]|uniref:kielin/chordin-like protein isoform X2 n=1 Tax=Venturia canescens TaxID=32260 RepID=UPI001C9CEC9E|nr:kielin/chordin-like protein isoform X2 [Venturia canescens]
MHRHVSYRFDCDPQTCSGPLYYYQELGCMPIYDNSSSCCARKYNCDLWKNLPNSKCSVNGKIYENGQLFPLREVGNSCTRCFCVGGTIRPTCAATSCAGPQQGCYLKKTPLQCCSNVEVCPVKEEDIPTCEVDGKTYKDGETFEPLSEPDKICTCGAGYTTGFNEEPYCITKQPGWCGNAIAYVKKIQQNCAPVYPFGGDPRRTCNVDHRCQTNDDHVVDAETTVDPEAAEAGMVCKFGTLTMNVGQKLNQPQDQERPMQCECEVPPVVTCRYLTDVAK